MLDQFAFGAINGLASGMGIFLVASGLTLIFGILKLLNMAQGAFFMIGAYVCFSLIGRGDVSIGAFIGGALAAGAFVAVLGLVSDKLIFARLRGADYHYVLIATFALMMVCHGVVKLIWGVEFITVNPPLGLDEPAGLFGLTISRYTLFVAAVGALTYAVLEFCLNRLWFGKLMQALASDAWMASGLGINVPLGLMLSVAVSFFLAGLAGGLLLPNQSLSPQLGEAYLLQAFFAVVIGGLGSIRGAMLGSILIGLVSSFNTVLWPEAPNLAIYVVLVLFLLLRPTGLIPGRHLQGDDSAAHPVEAQPIRISRTTLALSCAGVVALLASFPWWVGEGVLFVAGIALIQGVFALSWNLLFGYAGLASFGHAAFFAVGAYFTGWLLREHPSVPFAAVLVISACAGGLLSFAVGKLALRRVSGIFLAVLTIGVSEILRILISYSSVLGREDGLVNIPRPEFGLPFSSSTSYYLFLLACSCCFIAAMYWVVHGPFGRVLRCLRQDAARTEFVGVDVKQARIIAFTVSGIFAALAGSLYAPWVRIVTLEEVHWLASTQPVLNSLLGGVGSFWGPLIGTAIFAVLGYGTRTFAGLSELIVGAILLLVVLCAPSGLVGLIRNLHAKTRGLSTGTPGLADAPELVASRKPHVRS